MSVRDNRPLPTLAYALLSLLARARLSGYELSVQLKEPIGLFWAARHSQIYPTLARLERRGCVTAEESHGPGPRPTRRYAITRTGLTALQAWVGQPARRRRGRDELLLKVFASWVAEPEATRRLLRDAEAHHAQQLRLYQERLTSARERGVDRASVRDPRFGDYATLRRGVAFERGRLAWSRWLLRRLDAEIDDHGR